MNAYGRALQSSSRRSPYMVISVAGTTEITDRLRIAVVPATSRNCYPRESRGFRQSMSRRDFTTCLLVVTCLLLVLYFGSYTYFSRLHSYALSGGRHSSSWSFGHPDGIDRLAIGMHMYLSTYPQGSPELRRFEAGQAKRAACETRNALIYYPCIVIESLLTGRTYGPWSRRVIRVL